MFAKREEVEMLKEQIAELIVRNIQLEYENSILRAAATPETLAKLAQPRQQPPPSSSWRFISCLSIANRYSTLTR